MTPPAFQFYPDDFIGGTVDLTAEEVGAYVRLLCYQWGHGKAPLSSEAIDRVAGCHVSEAVLTKFPHGKNRRLEGERRKQIEYRRKQAINGAKGGRPEKAKPNPSLSFGLTQTEPKKRSPSPSPSPVLRDRKEGGGSPSLEEVRTRASMTGMLEEDAVAFWNHFESSGWIDKHGHPILHWQPKMDNWKVQARAASMEAAFKGNGSGRPKTINELRAQRDAKVALAQEIKIAFCTDVAMGENWRDRKKQGEYLKLQKEARMLTSQIAES